MGKFSLKKAASKKYPGIFGCSEAGKDLKTKGGKIAASKLGGTACRHDSYKEGTRRLKKMHEVAKKLQRKSPNAKYSNLLKQAAKNI